MINIMDTEFNGMGGSEMYRSWVFPELFPHQEQALLKNWPPEDLAAYVGGEYAKAAYEVVHG